MAMSDVSSDSVFSAYGKSAKAASTAGSAWSDYYTATANSYLTEASSSMIRENAKLHLEDAAESVRMAGETQRSALDETTNRYLQLGQDIGRIYAGAAGSGIDVSSRTVANVDRSQRLMTNRDVTAINHSANQQARQYIRQAQAHRLSYVNDLANASMKEIEASFNKKIAQSQARNATWSAAAQMVAAWAPVGIDAAR